MMAHLRRPDLFLPTRDIVYSRDMPCRVALQAVHRFDFCVGEVEVHREAHECRKESKADYFISSDGVDVLVRKVGKLNLPFADVCFPVFEVWPKPSHAQSGFIRLSAHEYECGLEGRVCQGCVMTAHRLP